MPTAPSALPPKTSERLLIDAWATGIAAFEPARVLTISTGRAQLARAVAERHPQAAVECAFLDCHLSALAQTAVEPSPPNLTIDCRADLVSGPSRPGGTVGGDAGASGGTPLDVAALPLSSQGDGELAREQLQQCYNALRPGGRLLAATDNPRDTWLAEQLEACGGKPTRLEAVDGVVYVVERIAPPRRLRNFDCPFAFRDRGRLFDVVSRPGVFSHRRIDPGARRLIDAMEIADGDRVLDIGCGWGPVALSAAARGPNVRVEALDSNARAVCLTRHNAERNGLLGQIDCRLEAGGRTTGSACFDVAIGNPPYYADFQIAELFIRGATAALRKGGRLFMVTKSPERYFEALPADFAAIAAEEIKGYVVVSAVRK